MNTLDKTYPLHPEQARIIRELTFSADIFTMKPAHSMFEEYLENSVKKGFKLDQDDPFKLQICDLVAIEKAWDAYASKGKTLILTAKQYRDHHSRNYLSRGFASADDKNAGEREFCEMKKQFYLQEWREEIWAENLNKDSKGSISNESEGDDDLSLVKSRTPSTPRSLRNNPNCS